MTAADTTWSSISIHYDCNRVIGVFCLWVNQHPPSSNTCTPAKKLPQSTAGLYIFYQYRTNERDRRYLPNTQYPHWSNPCTEPLAQAFCEHTVLRTFSITTAGQEVKRSLKSWGRSVSPSDSLYKVFEQEDKYLACISYSKNWYYTHRFGTQ